MSPCISGRGVVVVVDVVVVVEVVVVEVVGEVVEVVEDDVGGFVVEVDVEAEISFGAAVLLGAGKASTGCEFSEAET